LELGETLLCCQGIKYCTHHHKVQESAYCPFARSLPPRDYNIFVCWIHVVR
jgi:hypothetical protein